MKNNLLERNTMKIAMIDPSLFTWPYDHALIDALRAKGHTVQFYTKHLAKGEQAKGEAGLIEFFYPGLQCPYAKKLPQAAFLGVKGISHIFCMAFLWVRLFFQKPDVIHFQWVPLPVVDRIFIPLFQKIAPVVLTVHDSSPFNNNPKSKIQGMGAIKIMSLFDHLIVHTHNAKDVVQKYGIDEAKISRIAHGVLGVKEIKSIQKIGVNRSDNKVVVLLFGHLKPYKGADILIKSLSHMDSSALEKVIVRIVGKPQMDVEPLKDMARNLGVERNIEWDLRFIGDDELESVFASSDITAMPYREIDASGVLMVAMSIGKPIVATKIGLFKELLVDGEHGYLIEQEDSKALAKSLEILVNDADLRTKMGRAVVTLGQSIPKWDDIAGETIALYQNLR